MFYKKFIEKVIVGVFLTLGLTIFVSSSVFAQSESGGKVTPGGSYTQTSGVIENSVHWNVDSDGTLTIGPGELTHKATPPMNDGSNESYPWNDNGLNTVSKDIKKIVIQPTVHLSGTAPETIFGDLPNLSEIDGIRNLDTSEATSFQDMFFGNPKLTTLDVTGLHTSNAGIFSDMFALNDSLSTIKGLEEFNTSKATDMSELFWMDKSLSSVDVSKFDTSSVTNMYGMFYDSGITSLDLSNFNTQKTNDMDYMFECANKLEYLNLSNFDTTTYVSADRMLDLTGMNGEPSQLTKLVLGPKCTFFEDINPVSLTAPLGSDKWQSTTDGNVYYSPKDLAKLYSKSFDNPNTNHPTKLLTWVPYVETKFSVKPTVKISIGDTFDPAAAFVSASDRSGKNIDYKTAVQDGLIVDTHLVDTKKVGTYNIIYTYGGKSLTTKVVVSKKTEPTPSPAPTPNSNHSSTSTNPATSNNGNSAWNPSQPNGENGTGLPNYAAVKGSAVYATKKIYMYKNSDFKKSQRIAKYNTQKRINRPMFVVTGYARSNNGVLRYEVRDVNHHSKTAGKRGYITASRKYVVRVYYQSVPNKKLITVINPKGVHAYKNMSLTNHVKYFKKGSHLRVKKIAKWNLTTRYQLTNGTYVTANKKLVIQGKY